VSDCSCRGVPSMTPHYVHSYLRELGRGWSGRGCAVELGCWLGASTLALLSGLVERGYDLPYYCHDFWRATDEQVRLAGGQIIAGQDLLPLFLASVSPIYAGVVARPGDIARTVGRYDRPVEICLLDAPKTDPLFSRCMGELEPCFVPGATVLGLLDYSFHRKCPGDDRYLAPIRYVEERARRYELEAEWPGQCSCAFFRYRGG
jgi:hypothetical protein